MTVRIGLVGSSGWSEFMYLQKLQKFSHGKVVAIAARKAERLNELGKKYGIEHLYTDWKEMISSGEIDAIVVAAPDRHHKDITLAAFEAGIPVMCEKPLAMNAEDAGLMLDAAQNTGLVNNVMFTWRNLPLFRKVKELLDVGTVGEVYHFDIRFNMGWARKAEYVWRVDAREGNGAVGDLGVHDIDLTRWLLGEVVSVYAETEHSVIRPDSQASNDTATMLVELASGAKGVITCSIVFNQGDREMEQKVQVYGSKGSIEATLYMAGENKQMSVWVAHEDGFTETFDLGDDMWSHLETETIGVREFVENVALKRQQGPDFRDGYLAQRVVDAALESAATGRRITL